MSKKFVDSFLFQNFFSIFLTVLTFFFFCILGDVDITQYSNQTNETEADNEKKWRATSLLYYTFNKDQNGDKLRCVALHEAYDTKSKEVQVRLNIQCKIYHICLYHFSHCFLNIVMSTVFSDFFRFF